MCNGALLDFLRKEDGKGKLMFDNMISISAQVGIYSECPKSESLDFGAFWFGCRIVRISDVRLINLTNQMFKFDRILDVNSITERSNELNGPNVRTSEIQTKFCLVFQTERSDFGHLLYLV